MPSDLLLDVVRLTNVLTFCLQSYLVKMVIWYKVKRYLKLIRVVHLQLEDALACMTDVVIGWFTA